MKKGMSFVLIAVMVAVIFSVLGCGGGFKKITDTVFIDPFIVADQFKLDMTDNAPVKISWHGVNFEPWFFGKIEEKQDMVVPRQRHDLSRYSLEKEIIADLGGKTKAEVTMCGIYELLKAQNNGQPGVLLTNGYANIFYVRDASGVLCDMNVRWRGGGWDLRAYSVKSPFRWSAGHRVFSR